MKSLAHSIEKADVSSPLTEAMVRSVLEENALLKEHIRALEHQLEWFNNQVFGQKSEKRPVEHPHQPGLDLGEAAKPIAPEGEKITVTYQRGTGKKQRPDDCVNDAGLRFNDDVPVEVIEHQPPELSGPEADQYEIIDIKTVCRLAQRPASYVVLQYNRPVLKRKNQDKPEPCPAPTNVLERSIADVSLLVGLLVAHSVSLVVQLAISPKSNPEWAV